MDQIKSNSETRKSSNDDIPKTVTPLSQSAPKLAEYKKEPIIIQKNETEENEINNLVSPKKLVIIQTQNQISEATSQHSVKRLFLPKKNNADSQSDFGTKNRARLDSTKTDDSGDYRNEKVHIYKTNQAFSEVSSGKSTPPRSRVNKSTQSMDKRRQIKKPLTEVQEVCENASQFWEHSKIAFFFFGTACWKTLKFTVLFLQIKLGVVLRWILEVLKFILKQIVFVLVQLVLLKERLCPKKKNNPFKQHSITLQNFMEMLKTPKVMTMVLDLDETLIHHTLKPPTIGTYKALLFRPIGADSQKTIYVQKRPFLGEFIELLQKDFNIIIYTSSVKEYADVILDWLDTNKVLNKRYYRDSCVSCNGQFYKDLKAVDADINKTFILDNEPSKILQENSIVYIKPWRGEDLHDNALATLATMIRQKLEEMKQIDNNGTTTEKLDIKSFVKDQNTCYSGGMPEVLKEISTSKKA